MAAGRVQRQGDGAGPVVRLGCQDGHGLEQYGLDPAVTRHARIAVSSGGGRRRQRWGHEECLFRNGSSQGAKVDSDAGRERSPDGRTNGPIIMNNLYSSHSHSIYFYLLNLSRSNRFICLNNIFIRN